MFKRLSELIVEQLAKCMMVNIYGSSVIIGNYGNPTMSGNAVVGSTERNTHDEDELLRIYKKLDVRHKSDFMLKVFGYEDEYDRKEVISK